VAGVVGAILMVGQITCFRVYVFHRCVIQLLVKSALSADCVKTHNLF